MYQLKGSNTGNLIVGIFVFIIAGLETIYLLGSIFVSLVLENGLKEFLPSGASDSYVNGYIAGVAIGFLIMLLFLVEKYSAGILLVRSTMQKKRGFISAIVFHIIAAIAWLVLIVWIFALGLEMDSYGYGYNIIRSIGAFINFIYVMLFLVDVATIILLAIKNEKMMPMDNMMYPNGYMEQGFAGQPGMQPGFGFQQPGPVPVEGMQQPGISAQPAPIGLPDQNVPLTGDFTQPMASNMPIPVEGSAALEEGGDDWQPTQFVQGIQVGMDPSAQRIDQEEGLSGKIIGLFGDYEGKEFPLRSGQICTIGRGSDCNIVLKHTKVSRMHCQITLAPDGGYQVTDTSSNGTYYENVLLPKGQPYPVPKGALLVIGDPANVLQVE